MLCYTKIPACTYICNYIYNYTVDSPLNLPIPPNLSLTLPVSHLNSSKCFAIQYEHNKYNALIFLWKYIVVKAT